MFSPNFNLDFQELWKNPPKSDNPNLRNELYQPPLSAYVPDHPGSSNLNHKGQLSPMLQIKLNNLNEIRYHGYKTLRPIGINKTMEEYFQDLQNEDASNDDNELTTTRQVEVPESDNNPNAAPLPAGINNDMVDLDNDIPNLDSDEFMAQEVEYENITFDN